MSGFEWKLTKPLYNILIAFNQFLEVVLSTGFSVEPNSLWP